MAQFAYSAKNSSGQNVKGIVDAADKKEAIDIVRQKQLIILEMHLNAQRKGFNFSFLSKKAKKVSADDAVVFTRQLATIVEAGIPIVNALDILGEQMETPQMQERVFKIRDDVEAGSSFSEAIAKDKSFFSDFFVNMVRAGEASGTLDEILERLAVYLEKSNNLQKKVKSAMIYPAVVSLMALVVTLVMILKVIPVFKDIYGGFGAELPRPTQFMIDLSETLKKYFVLIVMFFAGIGYGLKKFISTEKGRFFIDKLKLNVIIFGPILRKVAVSKFTRTFSTLIKSGVPILNALEIVGKTSGNVVIANAVVKVEKNVKAGENIATPLGKLNVFPPMVVRMISVGEKTGELEKMLTKVSDFYEAQVDTAVSGLTSLIEPLIIAFLGIVIGGIVICMFLPILQISTVVNA
ncbi:MAG: type II secretion system F family protein [Candidatus Omnitrophica bacterium]|nr:type II secretion system F family protein [Candidatus Omnitrophota bacterium]